MRVKPAPGLDVRDPASMLHLPPDGADVPESSYWVRRLRSGDVVLVETPTAAKKTKDEEKTP